MPVVREVIRHILHHVNAEAATSDQSQVAGVAGRAQYVRNSVAGLETDTRDLTVDEILGMISSAASTPSVARQASLRRALVNMRGETRPQLAIQTWVGKARETR